MHCDEVGERCLSLEVGGMRLEHDAGNVENRGAQRRRLRPVVAEHLRVAHVDAGLHHQGDDAADRVADPGAAKAVR